MFFTERFQKGFFRFDSSCLAYYEDALQCGYFLSSSMFRFVSIFFAFRIFYDHKWDRSCWPPWPSESGLGRSKAANSATRKGTMPELVSS